MKTDAPALETEAAKRPLTTGEQLTKIPNVPCLYRHANGTYYAKKKWKGKIKTHALEVSDRKSADRKLRAWLANLDKLDAEANKTTLASLLELYRASRQGCAPKTIKTEDYIAKTFKTYMAAHLNKRVSEVPASALSGWLASLQMTNASYNRYALFVKQVFQLAKDDSMIVDTPKLACTWKDPRKTAKKRVAPTDEQFAAIVASIRAQKKMNHEQSANFVQFMGLAGLGQAEVINLTWADVDWNKPPQGWLEVRRQKTGKRFSVPIYPELKPLLDKLYQAAHVDGNPPSRDTALFTMKDAKKCLANACARLGYPAFSQRNLRSYHIGKLWRKQVDIKKIAEWQGHTDGGRLLLTVYTEFFGANDANYVASELGKLVVI